MKWNKVVNMLFNKVLSENEKYIFYFYLKKTEGTCWSIQYIYLIISMAIWEYGIKMILKIFNNHMAQLHTIRMHLAPYTEHDCIEGYWLNTHLHRR